MFLVRNILAKMSKKKETYFPKIRSGYLRWEIRQNSIEGQSNSHYHDLTKIHLENPHINEITFSLSFNGDET